MGANSNIEWTDRTWNPITGCTRVSAGCDNCYAVTMTKRLEAMGQTEKYGGLVNLGKGHFNGTVKCHENALLDPLKWRKPQKVFVNSMSDVFHKDVPFEFIFKIFAVMALCPQHTFQVLTKRPERMAEYFAYLRCLAMSRAVDPSVTEAIQDRIDDNPISLEWPLPNVWLGTSVEDRRVIHRIDELRKEPAAVRFLSLEPLIGDLGTINLEGIHWVIVGGESGTNARPMHPDWARSLRDQCQAAGVPFFFKQWGEWQIARDYVPAALNDTNRFRFVDHFGRGDVYGGPDCAVMECVGKHRAGRLLDGRTWDEFPEVRG